MSATGGTPRHAAAASAVKLPGSRTQTVKRRRSRGGSAPRRRSANARAGSPIAATAARRAKGIGRCPRNARTRRGLAAPRKTTPRFRRPPPRTIASTADPKTSAANATPGDGEIPGYPETTKIHAVIAWAQTHARPNPTDPFPEAGGPSGSGSEVSGASLRTRLRRASQVAIVPPASARATVKKKRSISRRRSRPDWEANPGRACFGGREGMRRPTTQPAARPPKAPTNAAIRPGSSAR